VNNFFKTKARIVRDSYSGYEAQFKPWWCPFYFQFGINTHMSVVQAEMYIRAKLQKKIVKYVEIEE
jgi:hypothetical protein